MRKCENCDCKISYDDLNEFVHERLLPETTGPGILARPRLELIEDFAELPDAGFTVEPFGGADGAERKAAAGVGVVAKFDARRVRFSP